LSGSAGKSVSKVIAGAMTPFFVSAACWKVTFMPASAKALMTGPDGIAYCCPGWPGSDIVKTPLVKPIAGASKV
jgi:hypothetical protein